MRDKAANFGKSKDRPQAVLSINLRPTLRCLLPKKVKPNGEAEMAEPGNGAAEPKMAKPNGRAREKQSVEVYVLA